MTQSKAVFLDRDGTLIVEKNYLCDPHQVELLPGASTFLQHCLNTNRFLFLFSNQSGINRGYYTLEQAEACNQRMFELLKLKQSDFKEICLAPETPHEPPIYRKPSPRFILEMIEKYDLDPNHCWMVGDKLCDIEAGINAKIQSAWISTGDPKTESLETFLLKNNVLECKNLEDFQKHLARAIYDTP